MSPELVQVASEIRPFDYRRVSFCISRCGGQLFQTLCPNLIPLALLQMFGKSPCAQSHVIGVKDCYSAITDEGPTETVPNAKYSMKKETKIFK
jgi:hypothetical protein